MIIGCWQQNMSMSLETFMPSMTHLISVKLNENYEVSNHFFGDLKLKKIQPIRKGEFNGKVNGSYYLRLTLFDS